MALQTVMTLNNGIELPNAYSLIASYTCNYIEPKHVIILLNVYKDKAAYDADKPEVMQLTYKCSGNDYYTYFEEEALSEGNTTILNQAYIWLQLLDMHSEYVEA